MPLPLLLVALLLFLLIDVPASAANSVKRSRYILALGKCCWKKIVFVESRVPLVVVAALLRTVKM